MPHLVIQYTPQVEPRADIAGLCRALADTMRRCTDEHDQPVFPLAGIRVLAYPATHAAVADGCTYLGFIYLNLRMGRGRSAEARQRAGEALAATARKRLGALLAHQLVGITLQIDEGPEVFDAKFGNLHAHFSQTT